MTRALLDANVLYPAPIRDIFLQLAASDVIQAKWTADIHREWIEAMLRNEPHRDRAALRRTRDLMDRATRDCLVTGYETLVPTLDLPDPGDRHVLAAAIAGRCDAIVTSHLRYFPNAAVEPSGIDVVPSQAAAVVRADRNGRRRLSMPRWGLIPGWTKDPRIGHKLINARRGSSPRSGPRSPHAVA